MTESDVKRASDLLHSRDEIADFLSARDPNSEVIRSYMESPYEQHHKEGRALPGATVVGIGITDADDFDEENADTLWTCKISRDVLERALKAELPRISEELRSLGVEEEASTS